MSALARRLDGPVQLLLTFLRSPSSSVLKTFVLVGAAWVVLKVVSPKSKKNPGSAPTVLDIKAPASTLPIIGNLHEILGMEKLRKAFIRWGKELDGENLYRIKFGRKLYVVTHDYETFRKVFAEGQANYNPKTQTFGRDVRKSYIDVFGLGLANATNEEWRWRRELLMPLMVPRRLNISIFPFICQSFIDVVDHLKGLNGQPVDVDNLFLDTFVNIIYVHFFGRIPVYKGTFEHGSAEVAEILHAMFSEMFARARRPEYLNRFYAGWEIGAKKYINWVKLGIAQARKDVESGFQLPGMIITNPIIEDVIKDGRYKTDDDIAAEFNSLIFAGHDTTTHTLSFACGLLARHPEMQEIVRNEAIDALGPVGSPLPTPEQVSKLEYSTAVFRETSRLYNLVPISGTTATQDTIVDDVFIPKGTSFMINLGYMLHREKYFPNPQKFIPERWLPSKTDHDSEAGSDRVPLQSDVFFNVGAHSCLGARLAMMEVRIGVAILCRSFNLSIAKDLEPLIKGDDELPVVYALVLRPKDLRLVFTPVA